VGHRPCRDPSRRSETLAKPLLSATAILDAALEVLDAEGADSVNARTLAAHLHCSTKTLYQQVGNREQMLRALVARAFERIDLEFDTAAGWQDVATSWCRSLRATLTEHRELARLMTPDDRDAIVLHGNRLVRVLRERGIPRPLALEMTGVLVNVSMRLTLPELSAESATPDEVFERTIAWLVQGMEADVAASRRSPPGPAAPSGAGTPPPSPASS
jgi:AcrR family transcriptional regulator